MEARWNEGRFVGFLGGDNDQNRFRFPAASRQIRRSGFFLRQGSQRADAIKLFTCANEMSLFRVVYATQASRGRMETRVVLIDGRFEFINNPDKLELFDIRSLKKDEDGRPMPVHVVKLDAPKDAREAGKIALAALRDADYLTRSEYFHFLDVFLAAQSVPKPLDRSSLAGSPGES